MIEFHYNIPDRSLDSIINSIALHWCPVLSTPEGKIAESILRGPREALLEEKQGLISVRIGWYNASLAGVGIGAYPCNEFTKEEHSELTALRYAPPSKSVNDYYITIYGRQAAGMGDYPLTLCIKDNDSHAYDGNAQLREFAGMAKDMGFKEATEWVYELQDMGLQQKKFEPPITEEILKKKMSQDEAVSYDSLLISEIQMIRFYWDFFGTAIKNAGYMPEKVNAKTFSFIQPVVKKELNYIAGFPTRSAYDVASDMIKEIVKESSWPDSAIVQKVLEISKRIMVEG